MRLLRGIYFRSIYANFCRRSHLLLKAIIPSNNEYVLLMRKSKVQRQLYRNFVAFVKRNMHELDMHLGMNVLEAFTIGSKV